MNYAPFIRHYIRNGRVGSEAERAWHASQPSFERAIEVAALAINSEGKRHSHQRRIRPDAIAAAKRALLAVKPRLRAARSFDALLTTVTHALCGIPHIGELYCYDTAFRIGAFLRLLPDRVYLHAGVREGARALGLKHTASLLPMSSLPSASCQRMRSKIFSAFTAIRSSMPQVAERHHERPENLMDCFGEQPSAVAEFRTVR